MNVFILGFIADLNCNVNLRRMKWLNRLIYKPIDYNEPIQVFREAIQNHYSKSLFEIIIRNINVCEIIQ